MTESSYDHAVTVWHRQSATKELSMPEWDTISIYTVETFGMPGDRYVVDMSMDRMIWKFRDSRDALMFKLRWSEVT